MVLMSEFVLKIAGLAINVVHRFDYVYNFCKGYITDDTPLFTVSAAEDEIENERRVSEDNFDEGYLECICIYRAIAEILPKYNRFVFHGATITFNDDGYVFTAPSGTGKSTHIKLWRNSFRNKVKIVNGDKPIFQIDGDRVFAYGTPWAGKEKWQRNVSAEIKGICLLRRGDSNIIRKISVVDSLSFFLKQTYIPKNKETAEKTLELIDSILRNVPIYELKCDISQDAVRVSFEAMTGLDFESEKVTDKI